jgi:hypothetical protein
MVVLVANRKYNWVECDEHTIELAPRMPTYEGWKNSGRTPHEWKNGVVRDLHYSIGLKKGIGVS